MLKKEFHPSLSQSRTEDADRTSLLWVYVLACSIGVTGIVGYLVQSLYHPDIAALTQKANDLLLGAAATRPEPMEALITRVSIVVFGAAVPGFYVLFLRRSPGGNAQFTTLLGWVAALVPILLVFVDFGAANPFSVTAGEIAQNDRDKIAATNFSFFFDGFFIGNYLLYYLIFVVPLLAAFFFIGVRKREWGSSVNYARITSYVGYPLIGLLLLAVLVMNTYEFPYTYENGFDFDTVYYSMTQVFAGSPMLVDDFTNTYGLYPHFLNPIFQLTGLSILKFSGVMALLVVLSFVLNFLVLRRLVEDKVILFLGFLMVLFFPYLDSKMAISFDSYFAMYPIRYLVPSVMLVAGMRYFLAGSQWAYYATFLFLGFAILWNPEIGLVCMVAWTATNVYRDLLSDEGQIGWRAMLRHLTVAVLSCIASFTLFSAAIRLGYGAWPDLSLLFRTMRVFGELGFNMLPMAFVHPWNLFVLIMLLGYLYSIAARFSAVTGKSAMVFLLTMTSLGFFLYFQGRSHNWSFSSSSGIALMLLVVLGDELWTIAKAKRSFVWDTMFVGFLLVVSFSLPEVIYGAPAIADLAFPTETKEKRLGFRQVIESNRDFIRNNTAEHEKTLLLTGAPRQGLYYDGSKRVSAFNPTTMEMFFNSSVPRLEQVVRTGPEKIFIEGEECRFGYLMRPLLLLAANYQVAASNNNMTLMKRRSELPLMTYFNRSEGVVFHRKYRDDPASTEARLNDGLGSESVKLDSAFSVEILFKSTPQVCPTAALICNLGDSSGLIIEARNEANLYYFGLYGEGMEGRVENNGWVYCSMNVYPDRVELFLNGQKKGVKLLKRRYRNSKEVVRIGSKDPKSVAYYMGAIAEVAIVNRPLPPEEIAAIFSMMGK